jgi:surface antigen
MHKLVAVVALSLSLVACQQPGTGAGPGEIGMNKTTGGALVGAAAGGLVGSQFGGGAGKGALTVVGVLAGAFVGSQVGRSLDENDLAYARRSQQQAFEAGRSGEPVAWRNPDTGASGTIVPRPAVEANGTQCREFQQNITVGGRTQQGYGTACRQPDGSWQVVQ